MSAHRSWLSALCKLKCDRAHHAASTLAGKSTLVLPDMRDMCVPLNKLLSQDKGVRDGLTFFFSVLVDPNVRGGEEQNAQVGHDDEEYHTY